MKRILLTSLCLWVLLAKGAGASAFPPTQETGSSDWRATVSSDAAVLYSGLSPTSSVVALLSRGEAVTIKLEITTEDGKWYGVSFEENSVTGYVHGKDLTPEHSPAVTLWEFQPPEPAADLASMEKDGAGASKRLLDFDIKRLIISQFGRTLPISAFGQTGFHDRLRFDHRNAVDVALHPDSPGGRVLLNKLRIMGVPFIAFRHAVPGIATGAHIHVGKPSKRR